MILLLDTSALVKRYREEGGSQRVQHLLGQARRVVMAAHCKVELAAGLSRDWRNRLTTRAQYERDLSLLGEDFADFEVFPLDPRIESFAMAVMEGHNLQSMDALHIGTAQAAHVDLFVTADPHQAQAAQAVGLKTELIEA
jgi:predicted nucleic acid-binding protein